MIDTSMDKLGMAIKSSRLKSGKTRKELADTLRVSPRHLMAIEHGQKKPSYNVLFRLVRELSIPPEEIFYPEITNGHYGFEQAVTMLRRCDEKEFEIISAALSALLNHK